LVAQVQNGQERHKQQSTERRTRVKYLHGGGFAYESVWEHIEEHGRRAMITYAGRRAEVDGRRLCSSGGREIWGAWALCTYVHCTNII